MSESVPDPVVRPNARALEDRLWSKVDRDGPIPEFAPELGPCWLWTGSLNANGYGTIHRGDRQAGTHRVVVELNGESIPEGHEVDHLCRVRHCVNPAHLEVVTKAENIRRGFSPPGMNSRKTHCPKGHLLDGDNLLNIDDGRRHCRICNGDRYRRRPLPTHCVHGHEFTEDNIYLNKRGYRLCRKCGINGRSVLGWEGTR